MVGGDAEDGLEGDVAVKSAVVSKDELVEVSVGVLAAEPMIGAKPPSLQKGEHPMYPLQGDMRRHFADNTRIVAVVRQPRIGRMAVCHQRRPRGDILSNETVDVNGFVAGDDGKAGAPRHRVEILRPESLGFLRLFPGSVAQFDGSDHQYLTGLERSIWIIVGTKGHLCLIDLDHAIQPIATGIDHRASELLLQKPSRAVCNSHLPSQLTGRHSVGMGRHQMRGPVPYSQRQLGSVHDRARRGRRLPSTASTLIGIRPAFQQVAHAATAFRTKKTVRPPAVHQQADAAFLVGKPRLELKKGQLLSHGAERTAPKPQFQPLPGASRQATPVASWMARCWSLSSSG